MRVREHAHTSCVREGGRRVKLKEWEHRFLVLYIFIYVKSLKYVLIMEKVYKSLLPF